MDKIAISPYLFRSLDIRGADPAFVKSQNITAGSLKERSAHGSPLSPETAYVIGQAIAVEFSPQKVAIGHDARLSSPELTESLIRGLTDQGVDVDFLGLVSTDYIYFAIGMKKYEFGIMTTGSHTIKHLNGFKLSQLSDGRVFPIAQGTGMEKLKARAMAQDFPDSDRKGTVTEIDLKDEFAAYLLSLVDYTKFKSQKIVFDAANGAGGVAYEQIIDQLPIEAIKLNFEPDGNFPNHEPDPMIAANVVELVSQIKSEQADFGVAWDGDADRITLIAPGGEILTGSFISPLLLPWVAERHPSTTAVITTPMSWAAKAKAEELGLKIKYSKVGNSFIKIAMKESGAAIGCEEADHFMFAETFYAESGILPVLIVLDQITQSGKSFTELLAEAKGDFVISGDVNLEVKDAAKVMAAVDQKYSDLGGQIDKMDGLAVSFPDWHFSLRPSSNDPVVRLNLEAKSTVKLNEEIAKIKTIVAESDV